MGFADQFIKNPEAAVISTKRITAGGFWSTPITKADGSPSVAIKGYFGNAQFTLMPAAGAGTKTERGTNRPDWFALIAEKYDKENPDKKINSMPFPGLSFWENKVGGKIVISGNFGPTVRLEFRQVTKKAPNSPDWLLDIVEVPQTPKEAVTVEDPVTTEHAAATPEFTDPNEAVNDGTTPF
jgi:hypothetical protein